MPNEKDSKISHIFPSRYVTLLADEVAKIVIKRLPGRTGGSAKKPAKSPRKMDSAFFLDTSAIIDGRILGVAAMGLFSSTVVILESILLELKHIADSQDAVRRSRGRSGLELLEKLRKTKGVKAAVLSDLEEKKYLKREIKEVDEKLIAIAKANKGKIITCDYNLEKKASIQGVFAINVNALANMLKVQAIPGESLHIKILHTGKDATQGVGYLDDGTMIVTENASGEVGETVDVVVARVIQTSAGRILFAKKI